MRASVSGRSAGRERHDHGDRPRRIGLRSGARDIARAQRRAQPGAVRACAWVVDLGWRKLVRFLRSPSSRRSHRIATILRSARMPFPRRATPPISAGPRRLREYSNVPPLLLAPDAPACSSRVVPAHAADEPDLIFKRSTVFKWLTPNDKLATYGLDDPEVEGVACHFTVPEKGGFKGWIGVAEEVSDISLACRQIGPIRFKAKFEQGEDMFRQRRSLFFKKMQIVRGCDVKRNVLVYMVYSDRLIEGSPKNSTSSVPIMPWGAERSEVTKCGDFVEKVTVPTAVASAALPSPRNSTHIRRRWRNPRTHRAIRPSTARRTRRARPAPRRIGRTPRRPTRRWNGCSIPASSAAPPEWAREPGCSRRRTIRSSAAPTGGANTPRASRRRQRLRRGAAARLCRATRRIAARHQHRTRQRAGLRQAIRTKR